MSNGIPAVMYHSVGIVDKTWHWNYLTCPYEVFENQLKWIERCGYKTLTFQDVYDYVINEITVPKKSVLLTFDDGYLDNYVFAYPLLKKYGMKGTIFVNPDFVDTSKGLRKTLDDAATINDIQNLKKIGFCNWEELRKMDQESVLDVQSHAKTHTWYPKSDKIIDFRHPGDEYIWMDWNENPENKPKLQYIDWSKAQLGKAIFEHEKALSSKRVFINEEFQLKLAEYVRRNGGVDFYKNPNWKAILFNVADKLKKEYVVLEKTETERDYLERITYELDFSKREIEKRLNKKVSFFCWPGGSGTKEGVKIANELGYVMSTAAADISKLRKKIKNSPDFKINRLARITPIMFNNWSKEDNNSKIVYSPGWYFVLQFLQFNNKYYATIWMRYLKYLIYKVKTYV